MEEPGRVPIFWLTAQTRGGWQRSDQVAPEGQGWASGTCFVEAGLADVVLATSSELRTMASCITLARIVQALIDALDGCQGGGSASPSERVPRGIAPDHRASLAQFPDSSEKRQASRRLPTVARRVSAMPLRIHAGPKSANVYRTSLAILGS